MSIAMMLKFYLLCRGGEKIRPFWKHYFNDCQAIIFVVNSAASDADMNTAREALKDSLQNVMLSGLPCLVLGNCQDVSGARQTEQVSNLYIYSKGLAFINLYIYSKGLAFINLYIYSKGLVFINLFIYSKGLVFINLYIYSKGLAFINLYIYIVKA